MDEKDFQQKRNAALWKACTIFRDGIDSPGLVNYIVVFLFIKYISDLREERLEELKKMYGEDDERIIRALKRERFLLPAHCTFKFLYKSRHEPNIGEIINKALHDIEEFNKEKLDGVFRNIDFNSAATLGDDRNKRLMNLLEAFGDPELDFLPAAISDVIETTCEFLISRFASDTGKMEEEFYTPDGVSELMARLMAPRPGERLYDPVCGSGSLLIKLAQQINGQNYSVFGQEINSNIWTLCKMNMFLHDIDNARIEWGDTIRNPKHATGNQLLKFDVAAAHLPFTLKNWGLKEAERDVYNRFRRGIPPNSKSDYAFITHMVESLNENGRMAVVVPHGVLYRGGKEGAIRTQLINENLLDAVIGLPAQLFLGTAIPTALLILKKQRNRKGILFIDASREYKDSKKQNSLRRQDVEKITQTYQRYKTIQKYSYLSSPEELKENEFNLNIPRYVNTFKEEPVDIQTVRKDIVALEKELKEMREEMNRYLKDLGVGR